MKKTLLALLIASLGITGCATDEYGRSRNMTNAEKGAIIGAVSGAVLGATVNKKNRGKGALIGAIGGGLAGTAVGAYMDKQAKDLNKTLASEVNAGNINIEKQADHSLKIVMTSATAFDTNSFTLKPGFHATLDKLSGVLNTYGKTSLTIVGHTDNVGSDASNQTLSQNRAASVEDYLRSKNVAEERLTSLGKGESEPRASNANESGRQLNRRVEILVVPVVEG